MDFDLVPGCNVAAHGRVVAATLGNGVGQTWACDPASGRLVAQDAVRGTRAGAGEMVVENGYPRLVSNASGHYRPGRLFHAQVLDVLKAGGVAIERMLQEVL